MFFCAIAAGEADGHRVFEDETAVAFLDARPLFPGHVLVVPKQHAETLTDLPEAEVGPFYLRVQRITGGGGARDGGAAGSFVASNNRVSQSVPHFHVHVVPRNRKDGLRGFFWPRSHYASDEEAAAVAARVRAEL
ncbi:HIT family protein [Streptomyces olivoverticillatus]